LSVHQDATVPAIFDGYAALIVTASSFSTAAAFLLVDFEKRKKALDGDQSNRKDA
jgi:hypothetical protein